MKQTKIKLHSQKTLAEKLTLPPKTTSTSASKPVSSANGFAVI